MDNAIPPARTVCHGCRAVSYDMVGEDGERRHRPIVLPGDGQVMREVMPGTTTSQNCAVCGGDDDGWVPGFVPPV